MNLAELQQKFSEHVRDDTKRHGLPIVGDGLRVYRNNYREQLRSALKSGFPYLRRWLGDSEFDRATEAHIATHFPHSWTLDHYGHDFPATVQELFPDDPEVFELAWLEWAMAEALVAEDESPVDIDALSMLNWDHARITFMSSMKISEARSNASEIWTALEEQTLPPQGAPTGQQAYIVWRCGLIPCFRSIPIWEFQALSALRHRFSFADACELLRMRLGADGAIKAAGEMLARWLSDALIVGVDAGSRTQSVAMSSPAAN